jgi:hypothetical protein
MVTPIAAGSDGMTLALFEMASAPPDLAYRGKFLLQRTSPSALATFI